MKIMLNGEPREVNGAVTLADLLTLLNVPDGGGIAILLNGEIARRAQWPETTIRPQDEVEIVRATVGG